MAAETPFSHILVPVDGSDASMHAGLVAMRIAGNHKIPITFVYVVDRAVVERIAATGTLCVRSNRASAASISPWIVRCPG